jgi:hypothetical protein
LQSRPARTIPPEFLQAFQDYGKLAGSKAIALALDDQGRWAYGIIARHATQPEANQEALLECAGFKAQSDVQENCRLYAAGDRVIW